MTKSTFQGQYLGQKVMIEIDEEGDVTDVMLYGTHTKLPHDPKVAKEENDGDIAEVLEENRREGEEWNRHIRTMQSASRYL